MSDIKGTIGAEIVPDFEFRVLVDSWADYLRLEHTDTTRAAYLKGLRVFQEWFEAEDVELVWAKPSDIRAWREHLRTHYAVETVNLWLSAVRRFYAFLVEEHNAPILNPAAGVRGASRRGQSRRHKRSELTASEVWAVLETCKDTPFGRRDRAILSLMAYCALRTVELQRSDLADMGTRDGRTVLWIRGKGHAEADDFAVLPVKAEVALQSWLAARGDRPGPLFSGLGNRNTGGRLSLRQIRRMVKSRYLEAGVVNGSKTTHSLRHSAISNAIRNGAEPLQVQAMARHRSFDTTLGYYHEIARAANPAEDFISYAPE